MPLWIEGRAIDAEMVWMLIDISLVWTWNVNDESRVCGIDDLIGGLIWFNMRVRYCNAYNRSVVPKLCCYERSLRVFHVSPNK